MIVLVASRHDESVRDFITRWAEYDLQLLSGEDLSTAGWRYRVAAPQDSTVVIGGRAVPCGEIRGVLTRRPCVLEQELSWIAPADREYVAAEMNAFLISWLSSLTCRVLNRPTANCLSGPGWRPEKWTNVAACEGMHVEKRRRSVPAVHAVQPPCDEAAVVTVVGERCLGEDDPLLMAQARRLASVAGVNLLQVAFTKGPTPHFLAANLWPDLTDSTIASAILEYLMES